MIPFLGLLEIYRQKYAFGFLEFPEFLIGYWHHYGSILYRSLEVVDGGHVGPEFQRFASHGAESQLLHTTTEGPGPLPLEPGIFKKVMLHFQYLVYSQE